MIKLGLWIKNRWEAANMFKVEMTSWQGFNLRVAKASTRVYMILLISTLVILTVFSALEGRDRTILLRNPSQSTFSDLNQQYPNSLSCPCENISIPYRAFISINVNYHPICSSLFVSYQWINVLFNPNISSYYPIDFRSSASGYFQFLSLLCSLTSQFVSDAINDFLADTFLSQTVLAENSFDTKIQSEISFLQTSTSNTFQQLLQLVRSTSFSNQLQTALQTSILQAFYQYSDDISNVVLYETSFSDNNGTVCQCGSTLDCSSALSGFFGTVEENTRGVYTTYNSLISNVTGFVVGCYAIEGLLKSTLECLFSESCLNGIRPYFPIGNQTVIEPLNTNETRFPIKVTVATLIEDLFVEVWSTVKSFDDYFQECSPILCSYTFTDRDNFLHIFVKILSLYGGLTVALRLCVPRLVFLWHKRKQPADNQRNPTESISFIRRCRLMRHRLQTQILELNLFDNRAARIDPYELTTSKIATRIYIVVTCLLILVLTIYTAVSIRTQTIVVLHPAEEVFENLYSKYFNTLECPCTHIAIPYENFVSLSPRYHPVCSSLFISPQWIASISTLNWPNDFFDVNDFRVVGQVFFSSLQVLCSFTELTVSNAWFIFKQSSFISEQLLSNEEVNIRIHAALAQFESSTTGELKRALSIIQSETTTLYAMRSQNYMPVSYQMTNTTTFVEFYTTPSNWSDCSCAISDSCLYLVGFYNSSPSAQWTVLPSLFDVPQFFTGCFIIQSVLQSSLECFFNQSCLDQIQFGIRSNNSINITILQTNATRFSPQTLIGELIDVLMVENWGDVVHYNEYFDQCASPQCSYILTSRNSLTYVITVVVGLCGGLVAALKVIVPIVIGQLRNACRPQVRTNDASDRPTLGARLHTIITLIKTKLLELNLFETELSWNDVELRQQEIINTRVHLLLLTISILILVVYTASSTETLTITINDPSQSVFEQLRTHPDYLSTLQCPCQSIAISYQSFTSISFQFHQLCSSTFIDINSDWTAVLYSTMISEIYAFNDFRLFALPQFRLLASLCRLANDTMTDAAASFGDDGLITDRAQSRETITSEVSAALEQFRLSTMRTFARTLDFTRSVSQGNGIVSAILSNWYFIATDLTDLATVQTRPRSYGDGNNCSCSTNAMCNSQAVIDGFSVPGFRIGCYPLDSLLQSTLECLYSLSCINNIKSILNSSNFTVNTLDPAISSPNVSVQSLVNTLFIDQWKTNITYEQYYVNCAPLLCSYTVNQRASPLYIATAIIGLYGGLNTAFKIIVPMLTIFIKNLILQLRLRNQRQINIDRISL